MSSVNLKGIYKTYAGGVTAVSDFNLDIADKEFIVLVGPSGCGKSTTLRMIAGLEEITEGELFIDDKIVNDVAPKDRDIAMVFQNYALYPHMSVFDNMAFGLKLKKMPKAEIKKRVDEAARILDIAHLLDRKPKALSGGQRQRVALGRAIVREPKVFLMDEPLSNLDAKLRGQMRAEISKLHKRLATTFIYVTHDQVEAMTMGTRIVVMKDGFIQQIDSPQSLYEHPVNMFVAGFIGSPPMNFMEGEIVKEGTYGYSVKVGDNVLELPEAQVKKFNAEEYVGKKVVFGIRPEDIHDIPEELDVTPNCVLDAKVEIGELMGAETHLHAVSNGSSIIARVSPKNTAQHGDEVKLYLNGNKIYLFDKETELAILN